jgi:hypothetical protein
VVRAQVLEALRSRADELAELAGSPQHQEPPEAIELRAQLHQLEALDRSGVAGLAAALADLSDRLSGLQQVASGPRYDGLAELFATPGTLELTTDEELRAIVIEFVAAIRFLGNPRRVEITLR